MTITESSEGLEHGTGTERGSVTSASLAPIPAPVTAIRDLVISWLTTVPVGISVLELAVEDIKKAVPDVTRETFGEGVDAALSVTDVHEGKVAAITKKLYDFGESEDRRSRTQPRRVLLGDFYSPFCENPLVVKKWGVTCQERLDRIGFEEALGCQVTPILSKEAKPVTTSPMYESLPVGKDGSSTPTSTVGVARPDGNTTGFSNVLVDDGLASLGLDLPSSVDTVGRKDLSEGRRIALSLEPVIFSGTGDLLPYPVWKRRFDLLCRSNGLLGDPATIFYALNRCLSPALVLALNPSPPGLGPVSGWVAEIARIFRFLSQSCSGVSDDVARLGAEQRFAVTCQKPNESIADYVVRFSNAASDLAAYTGKSVSEEKLRTNFIRGISASWRSHALDIFSRGGDFITLTRELSQRERLEKVVLGPRDQTAYSSSAGRGRVNVVYDPSAEGKQPIPGKSPRFSPSKKICYSWRDHGKCRFGNKCRFRHDNSSKPQFLTAQTVDSVSEVESGPSNSSEEEPLNHLVIPEKASPLPFVSFKVPGVGLVSCLLNSGAYWNYVAKSFLLHLGFGNATLDKCGDFVSLPNGVDEKILGTVQLGGLLFRVMDTAGRNGAPYLIIGVKSMHDLGIDLRFGSQVGISKEKTDSSRLFSITMRPSTLCVLSNLPFVVVDDDDCSGYHELSTVWSPNLLEDGFPGVTSAVTGWHQVVGSSGYRWRARELQNGESKDTTTQRYCIEVDSPYDAATLSKIPARKDYGGRMVGRLSPQDKDLYEKEVAKYVDKGWWRMVGPVTTTPYSSSALVVFPVRSRKPGASTPIRPVLDARLRNIHSPASSYEGPCIDAILLNIRLRWHPQSRVLTRDASSAFYRVRMSPSSMVELLADGMVYHSWRLCFGLRAGPCCLWSALTFVLDVSIAELPADMRSRLFGCAFYLYLDDLTLVIDGGVDPESSLAETIISKVVEVAARYGFDFPEIKGYDSVSIHRFKHLGIWCHHNGGNLMKEISLSRVLSLRWAL